MTAKGKITAARLSVGDRVMVALYLSADEHQAITKVIPSFNKRKGAHVATVLDITRNMAGTVYMAPGWVEGAGGQYVRGQVRRVRRRSDFTLTVRIDRDSEPRTIENVTPSQTFWLAPERPLDTTDYRVYRDEHGQGGGA